MILKEKIVIVTGSTTGIGRAIAESCVAQGARVVVHGRDAQRGQQLIESLGKCAIFHRDDLNDPDAPARIVSAGLDAFGRIDAIVNNAAMIVRSELEDTSSDLFDNVMSVNVRAPLLLTQAALPYLKDSRGCVVNIGSVNALAGEPNLLAYSISKGALLTLSKNLASAHAAQGVRFIHFNVGWVLTENEYQYKIEDGLPENWPSQLTAAQIPSGKMTAPAQVASVVCFWLSDQSRPFSGTVIELAQQPFDGAIASPKIDNQ